ncbi:hypothetical protein CKN86_07870 [Carnobacterium divergens]|uniref:leucine-rich repeat domain-containing protein n=1 Tax=Carnobacterium divergens TaxID=2748 RepID=UPI000D4EC333|nr:hypothetical protein [Carnobacterium divergens]MCO6017937.1 hypothetical protein [Carnobacterium divergens]TFI61768.1 hypothetical protein CKN62_08010 [Carnobacterium divergens]TFI89040.1 hypothetical protein CKN84_07900 [Carnobacterium divergens]TFJ03193.1 hypothetical protein CKN86_07870 [Carnobacterium divergens]TFJ05354.1 hypothetical protein CKN65_07910 [Carnobacterium divergens]
MQTKKLVFMGICLFGSLGLGGEYQAATPTDNEGISSITAQLDSTFQEEQVDSIEKAKLFTHEGEETDITFKDSTLENEVKKELNLTENEHVTTVNILNLQKLVSSGTGITDLTGLEYAKNLMLITFNDNQIDSLKPLEKLELLSSVGLENNPKLTLDDVLALPNLTELNLSNNPNMKDFSKLSVYSEMRNLWLNNSNLSNIDFVETMHVLKEIHLDNNHLTTIDKLDSDFLTKLFVNNNNITSLDHVKNISQIQSILIDNNELTSIINRPTLKGLSANSNKITTLNDLNAPFLQQANLDNNQIDSVHIISAPYLSNLSLRSNKLITLDGLEKATNLTQLNLFSNQLNDISAVKSLPNLLRLVIQENPTIMDFSPISSANKLIQLLANDTNVTPAKLAQLGSLNQLQLLAVSNIKNVANDSKISSLDFLTDFPALTLVAIDGHSVSDISKIGQTKIETYSVKNQQIRLPQVALGQKTILTLLDKDNNFPSTINFNTPGEISTNHPLKTNYVQWHQVGENSLDFSSLDDSFSGSVNQLVVK